MYSLRLLGVTCVEGPSGPVSGRVTQRRRLALLALLGAACEGGWTRDKLIGLLWPETTDEQARRLLSDSVYVLRHELGEDAVIVSGELLRLNSEVGGYRSVRRYGAGEELAPAAFPELRITVSDLLHPP